MATGDRLYFRADEDMRSEVEQHQKRHGHDSQSEATRELVEIGLRESRSPILYRLLDSAVEAAGHLGLAAIVVIIAGFSTTVLSPMHSLQVAVALLGVGIGLVAIVELARVLNGQHAISEVLPGVRDQ